MKQKIKNKNMQEKKRSKIPLRKYIAVMDIYTCPNPDYFPGILLWPQTGIHLVLKADKMSNRNNPEIKNIKSSNFLHFSKQQYIPLLKNNTLVNKNNLSV